MPISITEDIEIISDKENSDEENFHEKVQNGS